MAARDLSVLAALVKADELFTEEKARELMLPRYCHHLLFVDYQLNRRPSSKVRLPPLKMNLFRNCDELTKM